MFCFVVVFGGDLTFQFVFPVSVTAHIETHTLVETLIY